VQGALVLTQEAKIRSDKAAEKVDKISMEQKDSNLAKSAQMRGTTEIMISTVSDKIAREQEENTGALQDITDKITKLEDKVPGLNKAVCDGETSRDNPCDDLCGGAGCGKCGGLSCQRGALTKAEEALQNAKKAEKVFTERDLEAESVLNEVSSAYAEVERAEESANRAYDTANQAKDR
jgi:coxsackievirus/adenovirus receptor